MNILNTALETFRSGGEIEDERQLTQFFDALLAETDEPVLSALLTAWNDRGVSENELFGLASIMRRRCARITSAHETFVDIVGTGGSRVKTFNVSTAAAFVVAGAGIAVAKHGNGAASSITGSADVLAELGVRTSVDPETAARCLNEIGICFMFAPNFHRLSPVLGKVRRSLGFPTVFNILGPLCNPAGAPHHLIGVWDDKLVTPVSRVLMRLGSGRSWVVNGSDGLDEITLNGKTNVAEVKDGKVREFDIASGDFGVDRSEMNSLRVSDPVESAALVRRVLNGGECGKPAENLVLLSAAAAIHLTSSADLFEAFEIAKDSIRRGAAAEKLDRLAAMTNK
ncbi:MAG: anthranilate phosphoribosyltransferase [Acidobacteriota bacterium]